MDGGKGAEQYNACKNEDGHYFALVVSAAPNLAASLTKHLSVWTGQRWMVSLSKAEGEPTLAERDRATEKKRQENVRAHPLMQAVVKTFPDARMTGLKKKEMPAAPLVAEIASDGLEEPTPITEIED